MPDLLLELFSEEIPARMQTKAADDLRKLVTDRLVAVGLYYEGATAFATPRRLALSVQGLSARQPDVREERKGPRVGAPQAAIDGFLKSAGLRSVEDATIVGDKKGDFYVATIEKPGQATIDVLAGIIPDIVRAFPWPKSMRWGAQSATPGALTWVRPLHGIVATFGPETEQPDIVPFSVGGIAAGDVTHGHRFMAPDAIKVARFDDYVTKLAQARVVVDAARRQEMIRTDARNLAFAQGFDLVDDPGLLAEVAGLVEWPVVLMGSFDELFLSIPPEVIRTTIRNNQKCFVLTSTAADAGEGAAEVAARLASKFILVANIEASDGGAAIIAGNERVIRARLSDAKFFYETDLKTRLEDRLAKLREIVFHEKLGTQFERIERIESLAGEIASLLIPTASQAEKDALVAKARRAARLCKADLVTEMVGEFPELQGLIGKYYALAQGEDEAVARACEEHYKPLGPSDRVPTDPVSVAVALADKLDTLIGFWAIDEKPTGSKDPYALRRAALGVIRLVLQAEHRICLRSAIARANLAAAEILYQSGRAHLIEEHEDEDNDGQRIVLSAVMSYLEYPIEQELAVRIIDQDGCFLDAQCVSKRMGRKDFEANLLSFFFDRLKVQLREQGARHDLVDAILSNEDQDDLLMIVRRVEMLAQFLDTDDGKNLLAGVKRAANIIRIEEKKDGVRFTGEPDRTLYKLPEENSLAAGILTTRAAVKNALEKEDFAAAMAAIAKLRPRVDAFFEKVTVNDVDKGLRQNRLKLLNEIRETTRPVADFSKIEG